MNAKFSRGIGTFGLAVVLGLTLWISEGFGQPVSVAVSSDLQDSEILPHEELSLTLSITDPVDFYYFSTVVEFNPENLTYVSLQNTGITETGIKADGEIGNNRIGISVSRTDSQSASLTGEFLTLTFRVNGTAEAGENQFDFLNSEMSNSEGELFDLEAVDPVIVEVGEGIGDALLTLPESNQVTEGDPFHATGMVYASGVTKEEENLERLTAWAGISSVSSDPAGWNEDVWQEMDWIGLSDSYFNYSSEVAFFREPGTYYIALRFQLDDDELFYAGIDGFWDPEHHPSAQLEIVEAPAFRYTIAGWDFSEGQLTPTSSVPDNDLVEIEVIGASLGSDDPIDTHTSGGITYLNTNQWHTSEEDPEKFISIAISTQQFENLQLNSSQTSTGAGPGVFKVQVSPDGTSWEDLEGGEVDLREENPFHLHGLPIPEKYNDNEAVYIRWLRTEDIRQSDNDDQSINSTSSHRIGNIRVTGTNINPHRTEVLPGDMNNDGIVNAQDVLILGEYWLSEGPTPIYDFIRFEPREVEAWIPEPATYADANGDGIVDQRDLLPIGLNFGKSSDALQQQQQLTAETPSLARIALPELDRGEWVDLVIRSKEPFDMKGFSYRISVDGLDPTAWQIDEGNLPGWAKAWHEENRLIEFRQKHGNAFEEALSYKGRNVGLEVHELIVIRIRAEEHWRTRPMLNLEWAVVSKRSGSMQNAGDVVVELEGLEQSGQITELPDQTLLYQNYPNPFNPTTIISYDLSADATVRLDIYNIIGQHVYTLVNGEQNAGTYRINFDATGLSTGIYLYRLQADNKVLSRSMMLVK